MRRANFVVLLLLGLVFMPALRAQVTHIEMRVEGMT